jgi:hypothetical protein
MGADWLQALEEVGGRLVPAARAFIDARRSPTPGRGTAGVRWLADQLEDHLDRRTDPGDDDRFVEGSGAFLGLLLIEHWGGRAMQREGCHRVQLGHFGWFDPFVAIEEALNVEDPRACLSQYLSVAEREASDDGPISRVARAFAEVLQRERPDLQIASQFELTLELSNGASVDLSRLERVARDQHEDATAEAARRIISMLPGTDKREEVLWGEAAPRLLPRLVSEHFLVSLPVEQALYADAIGADVHLALQLRYGTRARYVRHAEVESWGIDRKAARQQAIENLDARSRSLRLEQLDEGILCIRQGDGLDGARLLLSDLSARLARFEQGEWIATAPHRDVLMVGTGQAIDALAKRAEDAARRAPHPVSAALFLITPQGPLPLQP